MGASRNDTVEPTQDPMLAEKAIDTLEEIKRIKVISNSIAIKLFNDETEETSQDQEEMSCVDEAISYTNDYLNEIIIMLSSINNRI
jgi:pyrimidine operon attenuation protein/uracil phosphoribosyltransferase